MLRGLLVVLAATVVVAAAAAALVPPAGPILEDSATADPFPTSTPTQEAKTPTGGTSDTTATPTDGTATATPVEEPFAMSIDRIEDCGTTCRDVTVSLTNRQRDAATDVVVYTRVFAGNSTAEGDLVYRGSEDVGRLDAGGTYTTTERVELTYEEAYAVEQAGGWVTIQTTVQTADRTVTFTERRNVA